MKEIYNIIAYLKPREILQTNFKPKISVIMSVYNEEKYLKDSIDSILAQTFGNFEFIIINDGSTDNSEKIILSYDDPRIIYLKNEENKKLSYSLNKAISISRGNYIARMDADDISKKNRLEIQYQYMSEHPNIDICGTNMTEIRNFRSEKVQEYCYPTNHEEIKIGLLIAPPIAHPTVILKRSVFNNTVFTYNESIDYAQDYDLWCQLINNFKFANINKSLLYYRVYEKGLSRYYQKLNASLIRRNYIKNCGFLLTHEECITLEKIVYFETININDFIKLLCKIYDYNNHLIFPTTLLIQFFKSIIMRTYNNIYLSNFLIKWLRELRFNSYADTKIIIYGYGSVGKNIHMLLKNLNPYIIDKNIKDKNIINTLCQINNQEKYFFINTVLNKEEAKKVSQQIYKIFTNSSIYNLTQIK